MNQKDKEDIIEGVNKASLILGNLSNLISEDSVIDALGKLKAQVKIDGTVPADDIVTMWEPLEGKYTVNELLKEIY